MTRRSREVQAEIGPTWPLRLGISACLLGQPVRYDGGHKRDRFLADVLGRRVEWVPVCPEVELGLGIPREPIRLEGDPERPRLVAVQSRRDHTEAMNRLARARVGQLARENLAGYVLKKDSPSCGMEGVRVHGGGRRGTGLFARALMKQLPLLPVEDEGRLRDATVRESFLEQVLAYARWQEALAAGMTRERLRAFHRTHALLLLAHDPEACRRLEALAAGTSRRPLGALVGAYGRGFMGALRTRATRGRHARALTRALGHLAHGLVRAEREELARVIADYRRGRVPLVAPITRLRRHARRLGVEFLRAQLYLARISARPASRRRAPRVTPRSPTARRAGSPGRPRRPRSSP
jgi:uncharacterized protein YbbK (DUF523 family)/uncharacterized protein YbgA (DUF1722 family)